MVSGETEVVLCNVSAAVKGWSEVILLGFLPLSDVRVIQIREDDPRTKRLPGLVDPAQNSRGHQSSRNARRRSYISLKESAQNSMG